MPETNEQMAEQLETWVVFADRKRSTGAVEPAVNKVVDSMERACIAGAAALRRVDALNKAIAELTYLPGRQPSTFDALSAVGDAKANLQMLLDELEEREKKLSALGAENARLREGMGTLNHAAKVAVSTLYGNSFDEDTPLTIRLLDGTCDATDEALAVSPKQTAEWLRAHDAEVRREALEEAANMIQQTTLYGGDADGAEYGTYQGRLYAIEQIKALGKPKDLLPEDAAQPAKEGV